MEFDYVVVDAKELSRLQSIMEKFPCSIPDTRLEVRSNGLEGVTITPGTKGIEVRTINGIEDADFLSADFNSKPPSVTVGYGNYRYVINLKRGD